MKIGIYDSGLGGLTVLKAIYEKYPQCSFVYIGDTKHAPYGEKTKQTLWNYNKRIIEQLIKQNIDALVIGCNTSAALFMKDIQQLLAAYKQMPVLDLISPTALFVASKKLASVTVFGTTQTIASKAYSKHLKAKSPSIKINEVACPLWVPAIESQITHALDQLQQNVMLDINQKMSEFVIEPNIDAKIFGCSHYPFLQTAMETILKKNEHHSQFINPADCVAHSFTSLFPNAKKPAGSPKLDIFCTKQTLPFTHTSRAMFNIEPKLINI